MKLFYYNILIFISIVFIFFTMDFLGQVKNLQQDKLKNASLAISR